MNDAETRPSYSRKAIQQKVDRVVILAPTGADLCDIVGPLEAFGRASRLLDPESQGLAGPYSVQIAATNSSRVVMAKTCGLRVVTTRTIRDLEEPIDTLLVASSSDFIHGIENKRLVHWLENCSHSTRRIGSISTGTFLLAEAGLLNGRRVTVHWRQCKEMAHRYPEVLVDCEAMFVRSGKFITAAGFTAGLYLALAFIEEDHGHRVALEIAQELLQPLRQPRSQLQFRHTPVRRDVPHVGFKNLQAWIGKNLRKPMTVTQLARRSGMSPRHFARRFAQALQMPPALFIEHLRVDAARHLLEDTRATVNDIARSCGFGSADTMRRSFLRVLGVSPRDYHTHFRSWRFGVSPGFEKSR